MDASHESCDDSEAIDAVHEFLCRCLEDQRAGGLRPLADYLAEHPGHEASITREYERLQGTPANLPGLQRIGPSEVRRELGRGGQAVVYLAFDPRLRREVALKVLSAPIASLDQRLRLQREATVAGRLADAGICPVFETGQDGDHLWLAMQFLPGRTLAARIADAAPPGLPWSQVLGWFVALLRSLQRAHDAGIVHRDLKPANVMIAADERPVLLDFGLAADDAAAANGPGLTGSGDRFGTPAYQSPELLGRNTRAGVGDDLWAVAVSLFEALTQRRPFAGPTVAALQRAILTADAPAPRSLRRDLPRDLDAVLAVALAHSPQQRYRTADDFAADLAAVLAARPIAARPPSPWRRLVWWHRRHAVAATALWSLSITAALVGYESLANAELAGRLDHKVRDFDLLAGVVRLRKVEESAATLFPAHPSQVEPLRRWLADEAAPLLAMAPAVEQAIAALRKSLADADPDLHAAEAGPVAVDAPSANRRPYAFTSESDQFLHDALVTLQADVAAFAARTEPRLRRRLRWAEAVAALTLHHPDPRCDWPSARRAIATADGIVASTAYRGLQLDLGDEQVIGLVPIGRNPVTGLWEFYDLRSAWDGECDPATIPIPAHAADGSIAIDESTGVVFVLLPGGTFRMGESEQLRGPGARDSIPEHDVTLAPFLLARHELTQAQWRRLWEGDPARAAPSKYSIGREAHGHVITAANPVEMVSWSECAQLAAWHGMVLPTESQWEYACRAGSTDRWSCAEQELVRTANVADAAAQRFTVWPRFEPWDDGHVLHAPVGSFVANAFGLHDVHGNVEEWCRDAYGLYTVPPAPSDGERAGDPRRFGRVLRGGSFHQTAAAAHSGSRSYGVEASSTGAIGMRPARLLTPLSR